MTFLLARVRCGIAHGYSFINLKLINILCNYWRYVIQTIIYAITGSLLKFY